MQNKRKTAAVAMLLVVAVVGTFFLADYFSIDPTINDNMVPAMRIGELNLTRNAANLNGSFTLENTDGRVIKINEFRINDLTLDKIHDLALYVNGTLIDYLAPLLFELNSCDTVNVHMIVPFENNSALLSTFEGNHFAVNVRVPEAQFWRELE